MSLRRREITDERDTAATGFRHRTPLPTPSRECTLLLSSYLVSGGYWLRHSLGDAPALALVLIGVTFAWVQVLRYQQNDGPSSEPDDASRWSGSSLLQVGLFAFGTMTLLSDAITIANDAGTPLPGATLLLLALTVGAGLFVLRSEDAPGAFRLFTVATMLIGVSLFDLLPVGDVWLFQQDSVEAVWTGTNPYELTFPDPYNPEKSARYYGEGVSKDGILEIGFPYPPASLAPMLMAVPPVDIRFVHIGLWGATILLWSVGSPRRRRLAVVGAMLPNTLLLWSFGWTETVSLFYLAAAVAMLGIGWRRWSQVFLGIFLSSKQYLWPLAAFLVFPSRLNATEIWRRIAGSRLTIIAMIAALLPWAATAWNGFVESVIVLQFRQPFRTDSLSVVALAARWLDREPGRLMSFGSLILFGLAVLLLGARTRTGSLGRILLSMACALAILVISAKQAFTNYYFMIAWLIVAAALSEGESSTKTTHLMPRQSKSPG